MQIGMSTASLFSKEKTEAAFEILHKLNIPVCEVFLSTFSEYTDEFIDTLLKVKGETHIYSVHTLNQQFEPELFNPTERTTIAKKFSNRLQETLTDWVRLFILFTGRASSRNCLISIITKK